MRYDGAFIKHFWSRVRKTRGCWLWTGYRADKGRGHGFIQARKISPQPMLTHRVAWELTYGPIPRGKCVLHKCDNPGCVRPSHLFLGTRRDNNLDRHRKGRTASGDRNGARTMRHRNPFVRNRGSGLRGEQHPCSKLTWQKVKSIRRDHRQGATATSLAIKHDISVVTACKIVNGELWKG